MSFKLMYITNDEYLAKIADDAEVDWIFVDLEIKGKIERQGHLDTVISKHKIEDVRKIKNVLNNSELLVRVNPISEDSEDEIIKVISEGADIVMLPYFKSHKEVETFLDLVDKKAKTCLLLETKEAVEDLDNILELDGIDFIHIGLNDLHLSYKMNFMFEPLATGLVDKIIDKIKLKGIKYGFGGIAALRQGDLSSEYIIGEHVRLGSNMAILSRTFYQKNIHDKDPKIVFNEGIKEIHEYISKIKKENISFFESNKMKTREIIENIVAKRELS